MAGPWEKYQQAAPQASDGPWTKFQSSGPKVKPDAAEEGFIPALKRGAGGAVIGTAQLLKDAGADELLKYVGRELPSRDVLNAAAQALEEQGTGTGAIGLAGEILGNPLASAGGASLPALAAAGAAIGATEANPNDQGLSDRARSAAIGAVAAPVAGAVLGQAGKAVARGVNRVLRPVQSQLEPEAARLAQTLASEGVELSNAQRTGSSALRGIENAFAELPFTSATENASRAEQARQFTRAALSRAGIEADAATPDVLKAGKQALGEGYQKITANREIPVDDVLLNALADVEEQGSRYLGPDIGKPIRAFIDDVIKNPAIDGAQYQQIRSTLGKQMKGQNPYANSLLKDIRNALDDAAKRSLGEEETAAWRALDNRYAAYKTIERAMGSSGNAALDGSISPAALLQASRAGNSGYATGAGPLNDLARAGTRFLRDPVGNSGTAQRQMWMRILGGQLPVAGYLAGGPGGAIGATALAGLPKAAQLAYNSRLGSRLLTEGLGAVESSGRTAGQLSRPAAPLAVTTEQQMPSATAQATYQPLSAEVLSQDVVQPEQAPSFTDQLISIESGGNPNAKNPNSTALGLGQFTNSTWNQLVAKYGKEYQLTPNGRKNPRQAKIGIELLARDNAAQLAKTLGREPDNAELYLAHFLGASGAKAILKNADKPLAAAMLLPEAAKSNRNVFYKDGKPITTGQLLQNIRNKFETA
jgi:hypothetical protein